TDFSNNTTAFRQTQTN
ncbi:hypothetical protein D030_2550B, partial [Vibrio parahaemolyticus AQ3810]